VAKNSEVKGHVNEIHLLPQLWDSHLGVYVDKRWLDSPCSSQPGVPILFDHRELIHAPQGVRTADYSST